MARCPKKRLLYVREHIDQKTNDEISDDREASALLPELGPDLNILAYAFNFNHFTVLRSVVMDPWVTETTRLSATGKLETVSFIDTLEKEIRKAVTGALDEIQRT